MTAGGFSEDAALHARRAASFGAEAAAYAEHRPDYPGAAVDWALAPVGRRKAARVLDLGAGTGKLTAVLARQGAEVTAVEPDPAMLAELRRRMPDVPSLIGRAEAIPLPDGAVDAVLVGQAFHWFDPDRAYPEIARVLRPGGVLGMLWNLEDDRHEWVAGLAEIARSQTSFSGERHRGRLTLTVPEPFRPAEYEQFCHAVPRTVDSLVAMVGTHSHILVLPEKERAEWLARIRAYLSSRPETRSGEFSLPLVTRAVRVVRR